MKAITVEKRGGPAKVEERAVPTVRPGYLLVQSKAFGINPADVAVIDYQMATPGSLLGCDYAGIVLEVGDGIDRQFHVGDFVCGATRPADPDCAEMGTFADQIIAKADVQLHIPKSLSFEQGAALGVAVVTTGRCLFDRLRLPYPEIDQDGKHIPASVAKRQIFIYGGSSCMGTMVIQFAKLAGFYVLTTSSPRNKDMVDSYGADFIVDHYSERAVRELIEHAKENEANMGPLLYCMDNISTPESAAFCARVLHQDPTLELSPPDTGDFVELMRRAHAATERRGTPDEKVYSCLLPPMTAPLPGITTVVTLGYSFLGEPWEQGGLHFPASRSDFEDSRRFAIIAEALLEEGKIRPHAIEIRHDGLQGIVDTGIPDLREKKVSGKKLVYRAST